MSKKINEAVEALAEQSPDFYGKTLRLGEKLVQIAQTREPVNDSFHQKRYKEGLRLIQQGIEAIESATYGPGEL